MLYLQNKAACCYQALVPFTQLVIIDSLVPLAFESTMEGVKRVEMEHNRFVS